jgi:hypothetical protein
MKPDQPLPGAAPQLPIPERSADIIMERSERQVVPGETAHFPFIVRGDREAQSVHYLGIVSKNGHFNRAWAHIVGSSEDDEAFGHYVLEVRPAHVRREQYGRYPLLVTWGVPGTPQYRTSLCALVIKPCVRLTAQPVLVVRPAGQLSLALENCGDSGIEVTVTLTHHGTSWSKGWEFELGTEDGPFEFSERFELPPDARRGEFELDISAGGISLARLEVRPRRLVIARKHIVAAAAALAAIAAATTFAVMSASAGTAQQAQTITFTSSPPASPVPASTYQVTATGGGSGNPITFSIDPGSGQVCSVSGATVTFDHMGTCVIDANQAGDTSHQAAPQVQQTATVTSAPLLTQAIIFTSTPPPNPAPGDTYTVTATGGGSGNDIYLSIDPASASVCSVSGSTVTFLKAGTCVINANEAGNASYQAAPQVQQMAIVKRLGQQITFTSTPSAGAAPGDTYLVAATGGGSGNRVTFGIDPASASECSVKGSTVTFLKAGTCVINAGQAGNARYRKAPLAQQTATDQQIAQTVTFTSTPPAPGVPKGTYLVAAAGGGSGNAVTYGIDPASAPVCSISGATVTFLKPGTCVINANEAGNTRYQAAPQAQQMVTVK